MRELLASDITQAVAKLCMDANYYLGEDIKAAFCQGCKVEKNELSRNVLEKLLENAEIAKQTPMPMCQDTGMTVVFVELGQEVLVVSGSLNDAICQGVAKGYTEGFLRKSVVDDPIRRINTKDNTPAVIHVKIVDGAQMKITVAPKGFGSENMSTLTMLTPSQGIEGVKRVVIETVKKAGPNPCPPIILGVGVGGTMEKAALMAKEALLRPLGTSNKDAYWDSIEKELLASINQLGIGPAGFGGVTTALGVHINTYATHIAGLPVAVNVGCHATRHAEIVL